MELPTYRDRESYTEELEKIGINGVMGILTKSINDMDILDKWTNVSLEAYWKQVVKECQEANATGKTEQFNNDTITTRNLPFSRNRISI